MADNDKKIVEVLAIEDDPFCVSIYRHYATKMENLSLNINHVVTLEDSLEFLNRESNIDVILLDYRVHSSLTGLEILQHIRAKGVTAPVLCITGSGDEEVAVAMMKAGASDYLVKGHLSPEILEKSISYALDRYEEVKHILEQKKASAIKDMVIKTSLNGLCMLNVDGIITYVNPAFLQIWEYENESEATGRSLRELLVRPEDFDRVIAILKEKTSWLGELEGKRKSGESFFLQTLFSHIEEGGQYCQEIMGSFIDITKMKDVESKREALYKGIMEVFALRAEEVGNVETAGHIHRVADYTRFIATKLSQTDDFRNYIDEKYINDVSYASMLHDVGKWRTPNEILLKAGKLTAPEWEIMKQHPLLGAEMLSPLLRDKGSNQYLKLVESVVKYHHERWDGTGYPEGLKGEDIPLSARIVSLADIYDALTSDRSYRKQLTHEEAIGVMEQEKKNFDPRIWKVFIENHWEFKKIRENI